MEQVHHIKIEHELGSSIREIAKRAKVSSTTVQKYVKQEDYSPTPQMRQRRSRKTDEFRAKVEKWLKADTHAPRKKRHTAHRIYKRLVEEYESKKRVFPVCERTIRKMVAEIRTEITQTAEVALPLTHPAGEAQVDFGETYYYENGVKQKGYHLGVTFPHSDAKYVQLFSAQNFECLAQGLVNIFEHIGVVPTVIRFDNMSTAVKAIKQHGEREITDGFLRLMTHFLFQSNFCNPARGREKGSVENYIGFSRRNYFVPLPEIDSLSEYNRQLLVKCDEDMLERIHYKHKRPVSELFAEDRAAMRKLPKAPFDPVRYVLVKTDEYGKVKFQKNRYSTAGDCAGKEVLLKVGAYEVAVLDGKNRIIVRHPRLSGESMESMIWQPYLKVLAKRPNALKHTGFFDGLPPATKEHLAESSLQHKKEILRFLDKMVDTDGFEPALHTIDKTISNGNKDIDSIMCQYRFIRSGGAVPEKNEVPANAPLTKPYELRILEYGQLMEVARNA